MADIRRTSEYRKLLPFIARASGDVGSDTVGEDVQALLLALNAHKTSDDHDGRYYTETEVDSALALKADKTITLTAGDGLTGGGNLSANRTFDVVAGLGIDFDVNGAVIVDLTDNFSWTGNHSFTKTMYASSIMPRSSDTYDLGSSTTLWRKIWGSELSAVVFAKYEQVLLGGWFTVSKGEGILPADILSTDTTIDLGAGTFDVGDIIVFRGISATNTPQVEYIKIASDLSGTLYGVTRNLDGTGANNWQAGTVFANYGSTGDGRIELNAYDSPRISVFSHSDTIANFREQVRIGDLINGWGYSASTYGGAFGAYEVGKANITIDPTNGIRIRNYDQTVIQLTGTAASFENFITLGTNGGIRQGTGTWGSSFTGTAMWNDSGVMNIGGWNDNVKQWWGGSDGYFYTAGGHVVMNDSALTFKYTAGTNRRLLFESSNSLTSDGAFLAYTNNALWLFNQYAGSSGILFGVEATGEGYHLLQWHELETGDASLDVWGELWVDKLLIATKNAVIGQNLAVHGTIKDGDDNEYGRPVFLTTPLNSTAWDGDARSTTTKTKIDLSAVFGVPAGVKAVLVKVALRDSGSAATSCLFQLSGISSETYYSLTAQASPINDRYAYFNGIVPCDANGDIYYQIAASGTRTMDVFLEILGYWL